MHPHADRHGHRRTGLEHQVVVCPDDASKKPSPTIYPYGLSDLPHTHHPVSLTSASSVESSCRATRPKHEGAHHRLSAIPEKTLERLGYHRTNRLHLTPARTVTLSRGPTTPTATQRTNTPTRQITVRFTTPTNTQQTPERPPAHHIRQHGYFYQPNRNTKWPFCSANNKTRLFKDQGRAAAVVRVRRLTSSAIHSLARKP